MTTAREIMTKTPKYAKLDDSVKDAAEMMAQHDIGAVPVCDADGKLVGMLTDRDIAVSLVAKGKDASEKIERIIDLTEVVTIGADDDVELAIRTMKDHAVRRLPVIDGTDLVGMVAFEDLAPTARDEKVGDLIEAITARR